jgi:glycosyltransferase involved in cell wall biosynthesis
VHEAIMVTVSVVVCTRDRPIKLARCLRYARAMRTVVPWELVVVDNGSAPSTREVVLTEQRRQLLPLRLVCEPEVGLGRARNAGWRAARGEFVAFVDDDCYATPTYVDDLLEVFQDQSDVGFVAGRVSRFDARDLSLAVNDCRSPRPFTPRRFVPAGALHGANLAFRRDVLELVDGFNPRLGAGSEFEAGEDVEAVARAVWHGVRGVYDPRPRVFHDHGRRGRRDRRDVLRRYDVGRGAYYASMLLATKAARADYVRGWLSTTLAGAVISGRPGRPIRELSAALRLRRALVAAATQRAATGVGGSQ